MKSLFILLIFSFQLVFAQNQSISDLELKLKNEKSESKKLEVLNEMVAIAFDSNVEQALFFAKKGVVLSEKIGNKTWKPKFYEMQGRMHANLLQLDSASLFFDKAMKGYIQINDKNGQATTLLKMAWVLKKKGKNKMALNKDLQALKIMEILDNKEGVCDALTRISEDLILENRINEALVYSVKAIEIADKYELTSQKFNVNFRAGNAAMAAKKYKQSLNYYNIAAEVAKKENLGLASLADITNSQGNALKKLGKYKEALDYYKRCFTIATEANYANAISVSIANLGETNLLLGNYDEALVYQLKTVQLQEQSNDMSNLVENYHHVSKIYEALGKYKEALIYNKKAYQMRDNVVSKVGDTKMLELLTKYETKKKEATISTQEHTISQQKTIQRLSFTLVGLLITILIIGIFGLSDRNKTYKKLALKNTENELLMKEIHHRVKNNLEMVSSLLALQSEQINDTNTKEAIMEGKNRVNSIGIVHQKLYQGSNLGTVEMKDYFSSLSESILDSLGAEGRIKLNTKMQKIELDIDTAIPLGLILNELMTNAIKYAFPEDTNGTITIKLEKQNSHLLHLEVSDDGVGKTSNIQGTGFGGKLISLLSQQLNGTMTEKIENGTTILFDFKI